MSEETPDAPANETAPADETVTCKVTGESLVRAYIMAGIFLAIGLWCAYDSNFTDHHTYPTVPFNAENINPWFSWAMNFFGQFVGAAIGLILLLRALRARTSTLIADASGIGWKGKPKIAWDQVKRLDASRLQKKGYLTLHYGEDETLTLDTWRLDQTKALVALIDRHVSDDKKGGV